MSPRSSAAGVALGSGCSRFFMECQIVVGGDIRQMAHRSEMIYDDERRVGGAHPSRTSPSVAAEAAPARRAAPRIRAPCRVCSRRPIRLSSRSYLGLQIAARYLAAYGDAEIGGDWYDACAPDGR
jgi:hypothetical protein